MAEQLDDFDRKDLKEFKILTIVGMISLTILFGTMITKYLSLPDYHVVKTEQSQAGNFK